MLKNKTKNNHADPYHPSDLFNLNGEGITWEETQQGEQDKKQHVLIKVLACSLIAAADIVFYLHIQTIMHALQVFGLPTIILVISILGGFSFWAFITLICLYGELSVRAIVWYRKSLIVDDTPTDSSEDNVLNYVRDSSCNLKRHLDDIRYLKKDISHHANNIDWKMHRLDELKYLENHLITPLGKLDVNIIEQRPVYLPVDLENCELTVFVIHNNSFLYKDVLLHPNLYKDSDSFDTGMQKINLEHISNVTGYPLLRELPDLFAKDEMRDALTAYIYAEHQFYEVEKTARRVLPEWTDDDSVLLEDYSTLRRWYANYRETCMNRIISLIEDYARDLDFKNDQKKTRSEAISRALAA